MSQPQNISFNPRAQIGRGRSLIGDEPAPPIVSIHTPGGVRQGERNNQAEDSFTSMSTSNRARRLFRSLPMVISEKMLRIPVAALSGDRNPRVRSITHRPPCTATARCAFQRQLCSGSLRFNPRAHLEAKQRIEKNARKTGFSAFPGQLSASGTQNSMSEQWPQEQRASSKTAYSRRIVSERNTMHLAGLTRQSNFAGQVASAQGRASTSAKPEDSAHPLMQRPPSGGVLRPVPELFEINFRTTPVTVETMPMRSRPPNRLRRPCFYPSFRSSFTSPGFDSSTSTS